MLDTKLLTLVWSGLAESLYMTFFATLFSYVIGLPVGLILAITSPEGIKTNRKLNFGLGAIVNFLRSVPFIILAVAIIPFTRLVTGTSIGSTAAIVPLVVAAGPLVARSVESSVKGVDNGVIEAARSMGATTWQIITKVMLPEALPSLISGLASATITVLGFSAMAGAFGGGGLGAIAINYGYYRGQSDIMYVMVILLVLLVQIIQKIGERMSVKVDKTIRGGSSAPEENNNQQ
ncbi:MAG: ABC transporter permease [Oscillospiraceae bacterium]|nr:ABC transporter permease [Oscillospiraceae bacterium]